LLSRPAGFRTAADIMDKDIPSEEKCHELFRKKAHKKRGMKSPFIPFSLSVIDLHEYYMQPSFIRSTS
jgi:hypothetical protein